MATHLANFSFFASVSAALVGRMPVEGGDWLVWGLSTGFVALFCAFVAAINLRGGRKLAAEAEAFEASLEPDSGG